MVRLLSSFEKKNAVNRCNYIEECCFKIFIGVVKAPQIEKLDY